MQRECRASFDDILKSIRKIETYVENMAYDEFLGNELVQDAVVRNLEIIGEAVRNIAEDIKSREPEIEWKKITGLRNVLIHAYFGIDLEIVWDIVKNEIPLLKERIIEIIGTMEKVPGT